MPDSTPAEEEKMNRGFSLVSFLLTVGVLGCVGAAVLPIIGNAVSRGFDKIAVALMR